MSKFFDNLKPIPMPDGGSINHYDAAVSIYYDGEGGQRRRTTIGKLADESERLMRPNKNFMLLYPALWEKYYGKASLKPYEVHAGLYALLLAIGQSSGLYPLLQDAVGDKRGNLLMDFCMYSIAGRENTAQLFEDQMRDKLLFSHKLPTDNAISETMSKDITGEMAEQFRQSWLKRCAEESQDSGVWLCIDGSNNDCQVTGGELAAQGSAKSHNSKNIVSFMWAVRSTDGMPVTWSVNRGSMPDCKAIDEIIRLIASAGMKLEGVILDRGFATAEVIDLLDEKGIGYVVMLKKGTMGFGQMMAKYSEEIRWKVRHGVGSENLFGVSDFVPLFKERPAPTCVGLYFDGDGSSFAYKRLRKDIQKARKCLIKKIKSSPEKACVPAAMSSYLKLVTRDGVPVDVEIDYEHWQAASDAKGYHAIASSRTMTAEEIHDIYRLRDISEKQYSAMKSQLGYSTTRVHSDEAIRARYLTCFIASILRTYIQNACKIHGLDTNDMIRQAFRGMTLHRMVNDQYEALRNLSNDLECLANHFGIKDAHLTKLAEELNRHSDPIYSERRTLPDLEKKHKHAGGRPRKSPTKEAAQPRRKPGRPKGSKNKKTLLREAMQGPTPSTPKRGRGRPKGSKNKKTLEREAQQAAETQAKGLHRRRGRPLGSKNKKTLLREAMQKSADSERIQGVPESKKPLTHEAQQVVEVQDKGHHRHLGRPLGGAKEKALKLAAAEEAWRKKKEAQKVPRPAPPKKNIQAKKG